MQFTQRRCNSIRSRGCYAQTPLRRFIVSLLRNKSQLHVNGWRRSVVVNGVGLINEVNRHYARLVLGWVTVCGRVNHLGM